MKKQFVFLIGVTLCTFSHFTFAVEFENPKDLIRTDLAFVPPYFIGAPADTFLNCGDPLPPVPEVMAFDADDNAFLTVSYHQLKAGTRCGTVFYERVWTATSATAETITHRQKIRYMDVTPPVLEIPEDTTIQCGEPIPEPSYHSYDACSWNEITFSETKAKINDCAYTLVRTWKAKDGCNNWIEKTQTIYVVDTVAPVITIVNPELEDLQLGEIIKEYDCTIPQTEENDIVVSDCCENLEIEAYDRLLNTNRCEENGYFRKWKCGYIATDGAGNQTEFFYYVEQYDTISPSLYNIPEDLMVECGDSFPSLDSSLVYASDNCSTRYLPRISEQHFIDPMDSMNQAVIRTWYFEDDCGNYAEGSQLITLCNFDTTLLNPDTSMIDTMQTIGDAVAGATTSLLQGTVKNHKEEKFIVYPNPSHDLVNVAFELFYDDKVTIRLVNPLGIVVHKHQKSYPAGKNFDIISLDHLADGVYTILLEVHGRSQAKMVLKTH